MQADFKKNPDTLRSLTLIALARRAADGEDLDALLQDTVRLVHDALQADIVGVWGYTPGENALHLLASTGTQPALAKTLEVLPLPESVPVHDLLGGGSVVNAALQDDPRFAAWHQCLDQHLVFGVWVPIAVREDPLGGLGVFSTRNVSIEPPDLHFLEALASLLAGAMALADAQNSSNRPHLVFPARPGRASPKIVHPPTEVALAALGSLHASDSEPTDIDWLVGRATEVVGATLEADSYGVLLRNEEDGLLHCHPSYRHPSNFPFPQPIPPDKGIVGQVMARGKPVHRTQLTAGSNETINPQARAVLCVPITLEQRVLGVLNAESERANAFTPTDERLLNLVAGNLANGIRYARLLQSERRRREEAEILRKASEGLTSSLELNQVLEQILFYLEQILPYDSACIFLIEDDHLHAVAGRNFPEELDVIGKKYPLSGDAITREILQHHRVLIIHDAQADPRFNSWGGTDYVRGWMGVPMMARGEVLGYMTIDSRQPGAFDRADIGLAQALANQAAIAIDNARLYEASRHQALELIGLYDTALAISSVLVTDALLARLQEQIMRLLAPDSFGLFLFDDDSGKYQVAMAVENGAEVPGVVGKYIEVDEGGLTGWVLRTRQPLLIKDLEKDTLPVRPQHITRPARSWMGVPLMARDQLVGAITLQSFRPGAFTPADCRFLQSMAAQIAIALENAALFAKTRQGMARQQGLNAIISAATAATDLDTLLAKTLNHALVALAADAGGIWVGEQSYGRELAPDFLGKLRQVLAEVGEQLQDLDQPLTIEDWRRLDAAHPFHSLAPRIIGRGILASLFIPILADQRCIGGLLFATHKRRLWSQEEVALIQAIARQVGSAAERIQLFERTQQHAQAMERLVPVSEALNRHFTVHELVEEIGRGALALSGAQRVALFMRQPGNRITCPWHQGLSPSYVQAVLTRAMELPGGQLLETTKPVLVADISQMPEGSLLRDLAEKEGYRSVGLWPLVYEDQTIAAVGCYFDTPRTGDDIEAEVMLTFTRQAAAALKNANLFEETRRHATRLSALYDVGVDMTARLDLDSLVDLICQRAIDLTAADRSLLFLVDTDQQVLLKAAGVGYDESQLGAVTFQEVIDGISGWVLREKRPTISADILSDPRNTGLVLASVQAETNPGQSIAVAPLAIEDRLIGTLTVINNRGRPIFEQSDLDLVVMLANQAAIALDNARSYSLAQQAIEESRQRVHELTMLFNVSQSLNSATLNLEQIATLVVRQVMSVLQVPECSISILNGHTGTLHTLVDYYIEDGREQAEENWVNREYRLADFPATARVLETLEPLVVHVDDPQADPAERAYMQAEGVTTLVILPLAVKGQPVGIMELECWDEGHTISPEQINLAMTIANLAAVAFDNARLFDSLQRRVDELSAIAEVSAALRGASNTQEISQTLAEQALELARATTVVLYILDESQEHMVAFGIAHRHPQQGNDTGALVSVQDQDLMVFHWDLLAELGEGTCIPLRTASGQALGMLVASWKHASEAEARFGPEQDRLLSTLADIAANALQRARSHEELEGAYLQTVLSLARAMDARDTYTNDHSQRLADWAEAVAQELACGEDEILAIRWGALLHDIGKIGVPDHILLKPGPLTDEEWLVMKRHPEIGAEIVAPVEKLAAVVPLIRAHQEKYDGSGYPDSLKGDEIPLGARILAIADAYSAITDERVYRKARTHEEALAEIQRCAGTHFDPQVVAAFLKVVDRMPLDPSSPDPTPDTPSERGLEGS